MADWIEEGEKAPGFTLPTHDGGSLSLSDLAGSRVVLFFYPKDDTPGCTKEACGFRDLADRIDAAGAVVVGVSRDSAASHSRFRAKHGLPFPLLVDADHSVAERYGAWREKTLYGKKSMGIVRSTFVIGTDGRVEKVFRSVKPEGHAETVAALLEAAD